MADKILLPTSQLKKTNLNIQQTNFITQNNINHLII